MKVKTKRTICRIMGLTLLLAMLGIVRGMDMGIMPVGKGAALALETLRETAAETKKADGEEDGGAA